MPYARPTLSDLRAQVLQNINSAQITDAQGNVLFGLLPQAILRIIGNATAGMSYEHYGYLDWISLQAVPWTATDEFLEGWAGLKGVTRKPATPTIGTATFPSTGAPIPTGFQVTRMADGVTYTTSAAAAAISGVCTPTFEANSAGSLANFDANTGFQLSGSVAGVTGQSTTSTQVTPGADQELDPALRTRMLLAFATPASGGDRADYIRWALAVPGVTRAWIIPSGYGPGSVVLYIMLDIAEAAANNGFPVGTNGVAANEPRGTAATGDQLAVANDLLPQQPVTALLYVCAPTPQPVNFTIANLGALNTAAMQASIQAALTAMMLQLGQVGGTVDPTTGALWTGLEPSDWYGALSAIPGLSEFNVTAPPEAAIVPAVGSLLTVGTITYLT